MMNCHHYDKDKFLKSFSEREIYKKISQDYRYLRSDINDAGANLISIYKKESHRWDLEDSSIFLYSVMYYLDFLTELNPSVIADIGCGRNLFKRYIPNIIGYDKTPESDVFEWFDEIFVLNNLEKFDCAFAINSLHFIYFKEFFDRINNFGKIIKPGGRGCLTFNLQRLLEHTEPHEYNQLFNLSKKLTAKDYKEFIIKELEHVKCKVLILDMLFSDGYNDEERYNFTKGSDWPSSLREYFSNRNEISSEIKKEIESFNFSDKFGICNVDDSYNGNIRIVFEV